MNNQGTLQMPNLFKIAFPQVNKYYLQYCTQVMQFTLHEDLQHSTKCAILLYNDLVILQVDDILYHIFVLNKLNTLLQVFNILQIDCYAVDITSNIMLNHITKFIFSFKLQTITHITMNIYTSAFILQKILSNSPLPIPQITHEIVQYTLQRDHIAVQCAELILE